MTCHMGSPDGYFIGALFGGGSPAGLDPNLCGILVACGKDILQFGLCEKYILRLAYCPFYCPFFDQTIGEMADFGD
jgi:hypothetical protein